MQIQKIPLALLKPDENNLRIHKSRNTRLIRESLQANQQYLPLVVQKSTMKILVGNGRFMVMKELCWNECDCVLLDITDEQALRLSIIDNRSSELAAWDKEKLKSVLDELRLSGTQSDGLGFSERELTSLFFNKEMAPISSPQQTRLKKHQCPKCGKSWTDQPKQE